MAAANAACAVINQVTQASKDKENDQKKSNLINYRLILTCLKRTISFRSMKEYCMKNPKQILLIGVGMGVGVSSVMLYYRYSAAKELLPGMAMAMTDDWQQETLKFTEKMVKLGLKYNNQFDQTKQVIKRAVGTTIGHLPFVSNFVDEIVGIELADNLLSEPYAIVRLQQLVETEVPKLVRAKIRNISSNVSQMINTSNVSTIVGQVIPSVTPQSLPAGTITVPVGIAEIAKVLKEIPNVADKIPPTLELPTKVKSVIELVKFADKVVKSVESGQLVEKVVPTK